MKKTRMKSIKDAISKSEWEAIEAHVKEIIMIGKSQDQLNGYFENKIMRENDGNTHNVTYFFGNSYFSSDHTDEPEDREQSE